MEGRKSFFCCNIYFVVHLAASWTVPNARANDGFQRRSRSFERENIMPMPTKEL
jgi:hypothetical protein